MSFGAEQARHQHPESFRSEFRADMRMHGTRPAQGMHVVRGEGKEREVHGLTFESGTQAMILPQDQVIRHVSRTDAKFLPGQAREAWEVVGFLQRMSCPVLIGQPRQASGGRNVFTVRR